MAKGSSTQRPWGFRPMPHAALSSGRLKVSRPTLDDGRMPIFDEVDVYNAAEAFRRHGKSLAPDDYRQVAAHIARAAVELQIESKGRYRIPNEWLEAMEEQAVIDNWWDAALEKQVSLKPHDDCKFCRLVAINSKKTNKVLPWMGTICEECGKARMAHRAQHPHMIDMGNRMTAEKTLAARDGDCSGFVEPNLKDIFASLDRIIDVTK